MASDVAAMLAALDTPPAHVVGLSLGGCVALALALDHPGQVRSLTLVNAFARRPAAGETCCAPQPGRRSVLGQDVH